MTNNKASGGDIPINILKQCDNKITCHDITKDAFPDCIKYANVTSVFEKEWPTNKENYRPVTMLPLFNKYCW